MRPGFLFCHCALKMPNESVVESMGKTVADHANAKRGCDIETYTNEAVTGMPRATRQKTEARFCGRVN